MTQEIDKEILQREIDQTEITLSGLENSEWRDTNAGRSKHLRIDDQLKSEDLLTWLDNLERVGRLRLGLKNQYYENLARLFAIEEKARYSGEVLLSEKYRYLLSSPQLVEFLKDSPVELTRAVEEFIKSPLGTRVLNQLTMFFSASIQNKEEFSNNLAGIIFEGVAFEYFKLKYQNPGYFVLSPDETFHLYQTIYPTRRIINDYDHNLTFGIAGTTIPDGLVIKEAPRSLFVVAAIDYKSSRRVINQPKTIKQSANLKPRQLAADLKTHLNLGDLIHSTRPDIPSKPLAVDPYSEVIYVIPNNSEFIIPDTRNEFVPISTIQLWTFINLLKNLVAIY